MTSEPHVAQWEMEAIYPTYFAQREAEGTAKPKPMHPFLLRLDQRLMRARANTRRILRRGGKRRRVNYWTHQGDKYLIRKCDEYERTHTCWK